MAARGRKSDLLTVRISPAVWVQVGRLSRESFEAIQVALDLQATALAQMPKLPGSGELKIEGYVARFEIDPARRLMTLTTVRDEP